MLLFLHVTAEGLVGLTSSSYRIAGTFFDIKTEDGWILTIYLISYWQ
jgi:hypothetical protein